jgi:hypothetical protein
MGTNDIIAEGLKNVDFNLSSEVDINDDSKYRGLAVTFYREVMENILAKAISEQAINMATSAYSQSDIDFNRGIIKGLLMVDEWFKGRQSSLLAEEQDNQNSDLTNL